MQVAMKLFSAFNCNRSRTLTSQINCKLYLPFVLNFSHKRVPELESK